MVVGLNQVGFMEIRGMIKKNKLLRNVFSVSPRLTKLITMSASLRKLVSCAEVSAGLWPRSGAAR